MQASQLPKSIRRSATNSLAVDIAHAPGKASPEFGHRRRDALVLEFAESGLGVRLEPCREDDDGQVRPHDFKHEPELGFGGAQDVRRPLDVAPRLDGRRAQDQLPGGEDADSRDLQSIVTDPVDLSVGGGGEGAYSVALG